MDDWMPEVAAWLHEQFGMPTPSTQVEKAPAAPGAVAAS